MPKLTYWVAPCLTDSRAYNIRARTRKEAKALRDDSRDGAKHFGQPQKIEIDYTDAFDLLRLCLDEGSIYEGN